MTTIDKLKFARRMYILTHDRDKITNEFYGKECLRLRNKLETELKNENKTKQPAPSH